MQRAGLAGIIIVGGIVLTYLMGGYVPIAYKENILVEAGKVAGALFTVALFLERSLAVVNNILFGEEKQGAKAAVAAGFAEGVTNLAAVEAKEERLRLAFGFLAAVFVAAAGARTLAGLLVFPPPAAAPAPSPTQALLFNMVDILLTAGLLAGGSNGLAQLVDAFRKRIDVSRSQSVAQMSALGAAARSAVVSPAAASAPTLVPATVFVSPQAPPAPPAASKP